MLPQSAPRGDPCRRLVRSLSLRPSWLLASWADQTEPRLSLPQACTSGLPALTSPRELPDMTTAPNGELRRQELRRQELRRQELRRQELRRQELRRQELRRAGRNCAGRNCAGRNCAGRNCTCKYSSESRCAPSHRSIENNRKNHLGCMTAGTIIEMKPGATGAWHGGARPTHGHHRTGSGEERGVEGRPSGADGELFCK